MSPLSARGEQYLPATVFFAALQFTDTIIALKLTTVIVWVGAGVSEFGRCFARVKVSVLPSLRQYSGNWACGLWAFAPGELVVAWSESQAWGSSVQHDNLIGAALGIIGAGTRGAMA